MMPSIITIPTAWLSPTNATHDFNDDNYSDIARREQAGDIAIWLMNGMRLDGSVRPRCSRSAQAVICHD